MRKLKELRKRLISIMIAMLMVISIAPVSVFAVEGDQYETEGYIEEWDMAWKLDSATHTLFISGSTSYFEDYDIMFSSPGDMKGCISVDIPWNKEAVHQVVVDNDTSILPTGIFSGCENLTTITLPLSFSMVYADVVKDCPNLQTINYAGDYESLDSARQLSSDAFDFGQCGESNIREAFWDKMQYDIPASDIKYLSLSTIESFSLKEPEYETGYKILFGKDKDSDAKWWLQATSGNIFLFSAAENDFGTSKFSETASVPYNGSALQSSINNLENTESGYFTTEELEKISKRKISSDANEQCFFTFGGNTTEGVAEFVFEITEGSDNRIIYIENLDSEYAQKDYWLVTCSQIMTSYSDKYYILSEGKAEGQTDIYATEANILPVFYLDKEKLNFISAANPASENATFDSNNNMTMRFKDDGRIASTVRYGKDGISVDYDESDDGKDIFLYVQGGYGANQYVHSMKVTGDTSLKRTNSKIAGYDSTARVWLEVKDGAVVYAKNAYYLNLTHEHDWKYSVGTGSAANKIIAKCEGDGDCDIENGMTTGISLTLSATDANYSGNAATITIGTEAERAAWRAAGLTVPTTISYEKADGTALASAPTSVGSYVAKVSPDGVTANASNTAKVTFAIVQEHSTHTYGAWTVTKLATATTAGERERVCTVCGHKETVATSYEKPEDDPTVDPGAGKITNKTDATANSCKANVKLTKSEIIKTLGLTSEELSKVENGVDISVKLEVAAVESKNVLASDKNVAEKKLDSDEKIGQYLDINLFKIVGDDKSKVTQLNEKIKVQITLPSDVKKAGTDYFIIRVHDGVATKLELTHVSGDTYTFETDRFSTYALGYKTDENGKDVTAPKTGDNNNAYVWMMLMIAGFGVMGYAFFLKRKEEN